VENGRFATRLGRRSGESIRAVNRLRHAGRVAALLDCTKTLERRLDDLPVLLGTAREHT
jgi:hypothetical protein